MLVEQPTIERNLSTLTPIHGGVEQVSGELSVASSESRGLI